MPAEQANELFDELAEDVKTAEDELQSAETAEAKNEVETEETETVEAEEEKKETPRVPLPELQAERKKRQAMEAELHAEREKYARLDERLKLLDEKLKPKEPEIPTYEDDPFEHLRQREDRTGQAIKDMQKQMQQFTQVNEAQIQQQELTHRVISAENEFRKEHPDYDDAIKHLRDGRAEEYRYMGVDDPHRIEQMIMQESLQLAMTASKNNVSPAEMAYSIALRRGYAPKKAENKLEAVEKGQARSSSLSNAGGGEERTLDIEALAEMDDADFAAAVQNGQWEKMMRGT